MDDGARLGVAQLIDFADVEVYRVKVASRPPDRVATCAGTQSIFAAGPRAGRATFGFADSQPAAISTARTRPLPASRPRPGP